MSSERLVFLEKAWEIVKKDPTVWDTIEVKDKSFYYKTYQEKIFLSSFKSRNLPSSPYSLTVLGKLFTKLSTQANIMSRCPGTEEVTFYVMLNSPQLGALGKKVDKILLKVAAPPLFWRCQQTREKIAEKVKDFTEKMNLFSLLISVLDEGLTVSRLNDSYIK